ncbi:MAG: PIG-L family deacetylase [Bacilli bacterium]|nr:PIG-L family deacetylase [Bacilli bacterium]
MKKLLFLLTFFIPFMVNAEEDLTSKCTIKIGEKEYSKITDNNYSTYLKFTKDSAITISCEEEIQNIYVMYNVKSTQGTIQYADVNQETGTNNFLNEVIKLKNSTKNATITYNEDYSIAEIYTFSKDLPNWVQDWQTLDKADLMLFSTHSDDEQLFFAGLMPTYINKGYKIQVVYFTNHYNNTLRYHEQLDGLWTIGIKYYPVISTFPDAYSESLEGATKNLNAAGYSREDALAFQVEQIRKYKPYVVVGHDEKGEYSHGQHMLNTDILKEAIHKADDKSFNTTTELNPWKISKLYLHLYNENKIVLDYDIPLENYEGKTAYEVSKEGYSKHYSQQYTWFTDWLNGPNNSYTSATQIKTYNPAHYGLYYSSVGEDVNKDDIFENVKFPITEILFNNKTDNAKIKFLNTYNGLSTNQKLMYIGITIILISSIGFIIIHNKKK